MALTRRGLAGAVVAALLALGAVPAGASAHHRTSPPRTSPHRHATHRHAHPPRPAAVALRLGQVDRQDALFAPGLAMASVQRWLVPGSPVTLPTEPLHRPVGLTGRPLLRLHLTHTLSRDVTLAVGLEAVAPSGTVRALLDPVVSVVPAALLQQGPAADVDLRLPAVRGRLVTGERLQLTLSEPLTSAAPDWVTLYFGALPGEDPDPNDLNQQAQAANGGRDPARLVLQAYGRGAFQNW